MEYDQFEFRISPESRVHIQIIGQPSQEAIDKMIAFLDTMRDTYPTKAELAAEKAAASAVINPS